MGIWRMFWAVVSSLFLVAAGGLTTSESQTTSHYRLYWTEQVRDPERTQTERWYTIRRANPDGSQIENLARVKNLGDLVVDVVRDKLYWTAGSMIERANLDGSQRETLVRGNSLFMGLAVDDVRGHLYWTNGLTLQKANLDGAYVKTVATGLTLLTDLAANPFWGRDNYSDWWALQLITLTMDPFGTKLYRTNGLTIRRTNPDGSQPETLVSVSDKSLIMDIEVDPVFKLLYWGEGFALRRAALNGSRPTLLFEDVSTAGPVSSLALHVAAIQLYWTRSYSIQRCNLFDGSQVETVLTNLHYPANLAVTD